jgi:mono/diheme cytochrome c family protein
MRYGQWAALVIVGGCTIGTPPPEITDPRFEDGPFGSGFVDPRLLGPLERATHTPPPIAGGTLTVSLDGSYTLVSDPDLDRLVLVDSSRSERAVTALEPGDEPGRIAEDDRGLMHVVLRGAGAIATYDPVSRAVVSRKAVCAMPRGIAFDAGHRRLHVTCREGTLVTLDLVAKTLTRRFVADDLRDIVVDKHGFWVSTFRRARVLRLDPEGAIVQEISLDATEESDAVGSALSLFTPTVAWRMRAGTAGGVVVLHQRALESEIALDVPQGYGAGFMCATGIVHAALSFVSADGTLQSSGPLADAALAVDFVETDEGYLVTSAGNVGEASGIQLFRREAVADRTCVFGEPTDANWFRQPVAIDRTPSGSWVAQARDPGVVGGQDGRAITFGNEAVTDTGHQIFHMRASPDPFGGGVACASCHPEAGDDSFTWTFSGLGARRTQSLEGGISGSEPFHWTGDMPTLVTLASEVFTHRMGGGLLSAAHIEELRHFLDSVPVPAAVVPADRAAVERGEALFASSGCVTCHAGTRMTNNSTVDVGTGLAVKVPSLVGVARRAPFMHTGCATDLRARFTDPSCGGGDRHGVTSSLSVAQIDDLVAYLESI